MIHIPEIWGMRINSRWMITNIGFVIIIITIIIIIIIIISSSSSRIVVVVVVMEITNGVRH